MGTKRWITVAALAWQAAVLCGEVRWTKDVETALSDGKKKKQPVAICFLGDEGFSARLEAEFAKEKSLQEFLGKLVAVQVDFDKSPEIAAQYKVVSPPAVVYLNAEGQLLGILSGYQPAEAFIRTSAEILKRTPRGASAPAAGAPGQPEPPPAQGQPKSNPMVPIAGWMDEVKEGITREETGPVVQGKIKTILDELDRLIEESSQSSSSSKSKSKKKKPGEEGSQPGEGEGEGNKPGNKPGMKVGVQGLQQSSEANRDGDTKINSPFTSSSTSWGQRIPVEEEAYDSTKARDAKIPAEYDAYLKKYFEILSKSK